MTSGWIIGLHLWSTHFGACYETPLGCRQYESETTGIYWIAPSGLTLGGYTNSYGKESFYAGWTFETEDKRFALLVAGVHGYPRMTILPAVVPSVRFPMTDKTSLRISGVPKVERGGAALIHIALEREI